MTEVENKVHMYIPHRTKQCLTYDLANVTSVETLLKMNEVEYKVTERSNAQFMSPTGYVPLIRYEKLIVDNYESIVGLLSERSMLQTCSVRALEANNTNCSVYTEVTMLCTIKRLEDLEKFVCWLDKCTYYNETKPKYSSVYPFPLNHAIAAREYHKTKAYLQAKELHQGLTPEEVVKQIITLLNVFSLHLSENLFLLSHQPKTIDALLFGHLQVLIGYQDHETSIIFQEVARYIVNNNKLMVFIENVQRYIGDRSE